MGNLSTKGRLKIRADIQRFIDYQYVSKRWKKAEEDPQGRFPLPVEVTCTEQNIKITVYKLH